MKKLIIAITMILSMTAVAFGQDLVYQDMGSLSWGIKYASLVGLKQTAPSGDTYYGVGMCHGKNTATVMIMIVDGPNGRFLSFWIKEEVYAKTSATVQCMSDIVGIFGNVERVDDTTTRFSVRFREADIYKYCSSWGFRGVTGINLLDFQNVTFEQDLFKAMKNAGWK